MKGKAPSIPKVTPRLDANQQRAPLLFSGYVYQMNSKKQWVPLTENFATVLVEWEENGVKGPTQLCYSKNNKKIFLSDLKKIESIKVKDTFVRWQFNQTIYGVRLRTNEVSLKFAEAIEITTPSPREKKNFKTMEIKYGSDLITQKALFGTEIGDILSNIAESKGLNSNRMVLKYRDLNDLLPTNLTIEKLKSLKLEMVTLQDISNNTSPNEKNRKQSNSNLLNAGIKINLDDPLWQLFLEVSNLSIGEVAIPEAAYVIETFVDEHGGYNFLRQVNEHPNHKKLAGAKKRSKIADDSVMPTLNDLPAETPEMVSKIAKEIIKDPDQDLPGSYGEEGGIDGEAETKSTITKKVAENAAHFGNNVKVKPGINPSAAFIVREGNHKGFRGKDKTIGKKRTSVNRDGKEKRKGKTKKIVGKQKNLHKEDQEIVKKIKNIAKEIDVIEKKKKKEVRKMKNKLQTTYEAAPNNQEDKDISTKNSHGVTGDNNTTSLLLAQEKRERDSFECPWSCYWSCQSYCPKECCNNPYNCAMTCREICSPYCNDRCCAPGARRLPKLSLKFSSTHTRDQPHEQTQPQQHPIGVYNPMLLKPVSVTIKDDKNNLVPEEQEQHRFHLDPQIGFKIRKLKEQSDYAAKLLGLSYECPSLCSKICTPIVCRSYCCSSAQQRQYLQNSPYPAIDEKTLQTVHLVQNARAGIFRDGFNKPVYCRSPRNCPPGGIVDPEYCPPICRSSCIQQCPNECCPNFGQSSG